MSRTPPSASSLRVADLSQKSETPFSLRPDKAALAVTANQMGISALRKLSFEGSVAPEGDRDWRLKARLGATVVQPCVVTLDPVTTRIETDITRLFSRHYEDPEEPEAEMPDDDTVERLGQWIDPQAVMMEALALHIPEYPRSAEAELGSAQFTEPGQKPMTDEDARPFAGLANLRDQLSQKTGDDSN